MQNPKLRTLKNKPALSIYQSIKSKGSSSEAK